MWERDFFGTTQFLLGVGSGHPHGSTVCAWDLHGTQAPVLRQAGGGIAAGGAAPIAGLRFHPSEVGPRFP